MTDHPVFREAFEYPFSRLDPLAAHVDPPAVAVYQTLMRKGPDGRPRPGLAEAWRDEGTFWDVRLKAGARFHHGDPCDARAVLSTLDALRWDMHSLPGGRQLWYWDPVDRVEAVDDLTLRFHLHYPHPWLPSLLWGTHTAIHNERTRLGAGDDYGVSVVDGTGPQRLVSWSPDGVVTTSVQEPHLRIEWKSIPRAQDRLAALANGEVDASHEIPRDTQVIDGCIVHRRRQPASMYLTLDWNRVDLGFDRIEVRRALSLALDRRRMVDEVLHGRGAPTWGPLPPGLEYYDSGIDAAGEFDPVQAEDLLDTAGWRRGASGAREHAGRHLAFECVVQDDDTFRGVAARVVSDLAAIGVRVDPVFIPPFAPFYDACLNSPAAAINKWLWPDTMDALIGFSTTGTSPFPNWAHASVPALDAAFTEYLQAPTMASRLEAAGRAQWAFARGLPYLPLLAPDETWAWRRDVRGFHPQENDLYPFYDDIEITER